MELVFCDIKYWEFVRTLRNDDNNLSGFIIKNHISKEDQIIYMNNNSKYFKICIIDNEPVGYIGLIGDKKNEITFCVSHNHKGRGIGTFMVSEFSKNLSCWAKVKIDNSHSSKIFEKLGFKKTLKQNFYYYEKQPL